MAEINLSKFDELYANEIAPNLLPFEEQRKRTLKNIQKTYIIGTVVFMLLFMLFKYSVNPFSLFCFSLVGIWVFFFKFYFKSVYQSGIKRSFYKKLFAIFNMNYTLGDTDKKYEKQILGVCKDTHIVDAYDKVSIGDTVVGEYKGLPIDIIENRITYTYKEPSRSLRDNTSLGRRMLEDDKEHTVTTFSGIYVSTKINKHYTGKTLIKQESKEDKSNSKYLQKNNYQQVKLEDVEFEKIYNVFSEDQIEARYLLTTVFMDRLLKYQMKYPLNRLEIAFSNDAAENRNIFFFVNKVNNNFEIPLDKSILDKQLFKNLLEELSDILDIIDALKLEQNIGM